MGQLWSRRLGRKWWQLRRWRKDDAPAEGKGRWSTLLVVHATIVAPFRLLLPPPHLLIRARGVSYNSTTILLLYHATTTPSILSYPQQIDHPNEVLHFFVFFFYRHIWSECE